MNKIPYQITLAANHGLDNKLSESQKDILIAEDCALTVAGLFWLINYAVEDEAFNTESERDSLFLSLTRVARLGTAVADELTKVIAQIQDADRRINAPVQK